MDPPGRSGSRARPTAQEALRRAPETPWHKGEPVFSPSSRAGEGWREGGMPRPRRSPPTQEPHPRRPAFSPSPLAGEGSGRGGNADASALTPLSPSPSPAGGGGEPGLRAAPPGSGAQVVGANGAKGISPAGRRASGRASAQDSRDVEAWCGSGALPGRQDKIIGAEIALTATNIPPWPCTGSRSPGHPTPRVDDVHARMGTKSRTLRVTRVQPCARAVAAMIESNATSGDERSTAGSRFTGPASERSQPAAWGPR